MERTAVLRRHAASASLALVAVLAAPPASAQQSFTPGTGFGAFVFPDTSKSRTTYAVQFDLFTELGKELVPQTTDFVRYNSIDSTAGFNQIGVGHARKSTISGSFRLLQSYWAAVGLVWDGVTHSLQNEFVHDLILDAHVPRDGLASGIAVGAGAELGVAYQAAWLNVFRVLAVAGGGVGSSTAYLDGYAHLGGELTLHSTSRELLRAGAIARFGAVGDAYHRDRLHLGLDDRYRVLQLWLVLPLDDWFLSSPWMPRVRFAHSRQRGLFLDSGTGAQKRERYVSVQLEAIRGKWAIESWNDVLDKDYGPTYGLRIRWYR